MRNLRDIVYFDTDLQENTTRYYGITFGEFVKIVPRELNNILLIKEEYWRGRYNQNTFLYYITDKELERFIQDNEYDRGDLCWVDFDIKDKLDTLTPQEIAELLYLGHKQQPLNTLFYENLKNYYVYCGHDDGWRTLLYCKETRDISEIISNTILLNLEFLKRRKIYALNESVKEELLILSGDGLLIDFHNVITSKNVISIPLYVIGSKLNMDDMYNNQEKLKYDAKFKGWLEQKNKEWILSDK